MWTVTDGTLRRLARLDGGEKEDRFPRQGDRRDGGMKYFLMIIFLSLISYMIFISYMQLNHPNHFNAF